MIQVGEAFFKNYFEMYAAYICCAEDLDILKASCSGLKYNPFALAAFGKA